MAHSPTIRAIKGYSNESIKQNNPLLFLQKFGPLHSRWHSTSFRNNLGFLLFHWHVVTAFRNCHADQIWPGGIQPFTLAEWVQFNWPYDLSVDVSAGDFESLVAFSANIENWHNEAHMAVGMMTGEDLMNPATNVFLRNFWRLHYFIDEHFLEVLNIFDGKGTIEQQISRIEKKYHPRLGEL